MLAAHSPFGRLNINRAKLEDNIQEFCEREFDSYQIDGIKLLSDKSHQYRCKMTADGKNLIIDFYFNDDGTTTIQPIVGKEQTIQLSLALHILSKIDPKAASPSANYSVRLVKEHVDMVISYLQELPGVQKLAETTSPDMGYILYRFAGPTGDKLVLKHYTNGTFQVQGKPLYLYQEVTCFLSQYLPFEEAVHNQEQAYCIRLDVAEIKQEIIDLLPKAHVILDTILQNKLVSSLAFKKIDINLLDYSSFIHPTLIVLEGYIKRLLYNNGRIITGNINCFTKDDATGLYILQNNVITCPNTARAIEEAYNYYSKERHGHMHAGGIPDSHAIIEDPAIANQKIMEILAVIESTYAYIVP